MKRQILRRPLGMLLMASILLFSGILKSFSAEKPFRVELFYSPEYLTEAKTIQQAYEDRWSNFATLSHFIVGQQPEQSDRTTKTAWDVNPISEDDSRIKGLLPQVTIHIQNQDRPEELLSERNFRPEPIKEVFKRYRDLLREGDTAAWVTAGVLAVLGGGSRLVLATSTASDADDAFKDAEGISPDPKNNPSLTPAELEKQLEAWKKARKLDRRSERLKPVTALNFLADSLPFWLDGINRSPNRWWIMGGYGVKAVILAGLGLWEHEIDDAENQLKQATNDEDKLYHQGRLEAEKEKRKMYVVNAGLDVAVGLLWLLYDPQDGLSSDGLRWLTHNPNQLPMDLSYHSDGKNDHEFRLTFQKRF